MEKYNKRVPGRISGVLLILLGGLGMAYKILLVWMDILLMQEFQNEELPELARTQMVFTAKDVCLAILCLILLIWGVRKIVALWSGFTGLKSLSEIVRSWLLRNLQKSFIHQRRKSAVNWR